MTLPLVHLVALLVIGVLPVAAASSEPDVQPASTAQATPRPTATATATPGATPTGVPVALTRDGSSAFEVVVRSPASPPVTFAAAELVKYIAQISGATLATDAAGGRGPRIVVGLRRDLSAADQKLLPKPAKGFDGYAVRVATDVGGAPRIVIGGDEPRGVVYGVYDLLERLGCRFFHPALDPMDPPIVPHAPSLTLASDRWAVASPMKYRTLAWFEWRNPVKGLETTPAELRAQIEWAMKARYNSFETAAAELPTDDPLSRALQAAHERGMLLQVPGHNFDRFLPSDPETFAAHPEWFGWKNGKRVRHETYGAQFCWTNHEAQKQFTDNVVRFVREHPDVDILALSALDGSDQVPCSCEQCSKHSPTDNVLELLNGVVARLAVEAPHVVVETLGGYQYSDQPPKDVKPDPRLRVFWAHWGRSPTLSYDTESYVKKRTQLEIWARAFDDRLTAFQYYSDHFANSWFTSPLAMQIEGDRRFLVRLGVDGMLNLLYPDGYWWRSSLNAYLAGRSFYDASLDPFALLRDYAMTYYGPVGAPMADYFAEWARIPQLGMRSRDQAMVFHLGMLREQRTKWLQPALAAVQSDPVHRQRMTRLLSMHVLAETIMESDIAHQQVDELANGGDRVAAGKQLARARQRLEMAKELAKGLVALNAGLVGGDLIDELLRSKEIRLAEQQAELDRLPGKAEPDAPGSDAEAGARAATPSDGTQRSPANPATAPAAP